MNQNIIVYGDFTLDLKKYPRKGTSKENTDIIIITFLMHEEYLTKCAKSLDDAIKYFNGCKEYFYNYHTPDNVIKRYSAKEIIQLHTMITNHPLRNTNDYYNFMKNFQYADQCYISYLKCRNFYMDLFKSIKNAKDAHFERRDYFYKIVPPMEIYGFMKNNIVGQIYSAYELMELFTFTHYLKNHKIIKELPIPSFVEKINEEENNKYMKRLYEIPKKNIYKAEKNIEKEFQNKNVFRKILKNKNIKKNQEEDLEEEDLEEEDLEEEEEEEDCEACNIQPNLSQLTFENFHKKNYNNLNNNNYESKNRVTNTSLWDSNQSSIFN